MTSRVAALLLLFASALFAFEVPVSPPVGRYALPSQWHPQAASDGTDFLVTWIDIHDGSGKEVVRAARVDRSGNVLDPVGIRVSPPGVPSFAPAVVPPVVAWNGSVYVVFWPFGLPGGGQGVRAARVDRDGHVLDALTSNITTGLWRAGAVAAAGDRMLLVTSAAQNRVTGWLLNDRGDRLTSAFVPPGPRGVDSQAAVASNGRAFLVAGLHAEDGGNFVAITPVSRDDVPGPTRIVPAGTIPPAVVSNGGDYLVTYADRDGALIAERVDEQGALVSRSVLPYRVEPSRQPLSAAAYGSGYVIATPAPSVTAFQVDAGGNFIAAISVTSHDSAIEPVALASNGSETLAAWTETPFGPLGASEVFARLVGERGEGALVSRAAAAQRGVKLATDGATVFAVWLEQQAGIPPLHAPAPYPSVRCGRFTRDGVALDGDGIVLGQSGSSDNVAVTFDGHDYLVAWAEVEPPVLRYARVAPDGRLLDPTPRTIDIQPGFGGIALASNGRESLLIFPPFDFGLRAAVIAQDGSVRGFPDRVSWERDPDSHPAAAWGGSVWLAAWEVLVPIPHARNLDPQALPEIHAARLGATAEPLDAMPIVVSDKGAIRPAIASDGDGFLVAWSGFIVRARRVGADGALGDPVAFSTGNYPAVTARDGDYVVAWIDGADIVFAPLSAPSLRLSLATGADALSRVALLGSFAAYDRVAAEAGDETRGFLRAYEIARPRPTAR